MAAEKNNKTLNVPNLRFPEFSGEWESIVLLDIYTFQYGEFNKNPDNGGEYPIYGANGVIGGYTRYNAENSVVIGHMGAYAGTVLYEKGKHFVTYNGTIGTPKDNERLSTIFGYYMLTSLNIQKICAGSGLPFLSYDILNKIKSHIPSFAEQQKIANFLSLIDQRIETQKKVIEDLKKLKDAIREKLFREVEKHCEVYDEIRNMLDYEQPSEYLVSSTEYSDNYHTPVLTANKAFILGYTDEVHGIYDKGDCIIFDDFTMDLKYVTFPFKVKSSAIKILTSKKDMDLYFMYEYLLFLDLVSEEHKRHYISEIEPKSISCPPLQEQRRIARTLRALDVKVENAITHCDLLLKQKQSLLNQLFI